MSQMAYAKPWQNLTEARWLDRPLMALCSDHLSLRSEAGGVSTACGVPCTVSHLRLRIILA